MLSRRLFLMAGAVAASAQQSKRLLIDTHLEVWTLDPKFPFQHPERPNLKVAMAAPIENQVEQMRDFNIRYAVLINPRYFGWDNSYISYSLHKHPDLFVAHGLINPLDPNVHERLRYWVKEHGFQGMRFSPIYHPKSTWLNSKEHYPLWREAEKLNAVFNYYILPHQMPIDRKSTRLNSSHSQISYAVFCLKKKNKNDGIFFDQPRNCILISLYKNYL